MSPQKKKFIHFIPRYGQFKILILPSTADSGTAYILVEEGLKFWYFV